MADAADSKSVDRKGVWGRRPPPAPTLFKNPQYMTKVRFKRVFNDLGVQSSAG